MSYVSIEDSRRTFKDDSGQSWMAERIGRTSGIVTGGKPSGLPEPSDIIRFSCQSDSDQPEREATMPAGALEEIDEAELRRIHQSARILPNPSR